MELPATYDETLDPKNFINNKFIKKMVHEKKKEKFLKIAARGFKLASDL